MISQSFFFDNRSDHLRVLGHKHKFQYEGHLDCSFLPPVSKSTQKSTKSDLSCYNQHQHPITASRDPESISMILSKNAHKIPVLLPDDKYFEKTSPHRNRPIKRIRTSSIDIEYKSHENKSQIIFPYQSNSSQPNKFTVSSNLSTPNYSCTESIYQWWKSNPKVRVGSDLDSAVSVNFEKNQMDVSSSIKPHEIGPAKTSCKMCHRPHLSIYINDNDNKESESSHLISTQSSAKSQNSLFSYFKSTSTIKPNKIHTFEPNESILQIHENPQQSKTSYNSEFCQECNNLAIMRGQKTLHHYFKKDSSCSNFILRDMDLDNDNDMMIG